MWINRTQIQHKYNQYQKFKDIKPGIHAKDFLKVFPFQIITGGYLTTNSGFKGLNSYVNDYNDLALIFSGQEAITAEWRNSVTIKKVQDKNDPSDPDKNYLERKRDVGIFFEGMRVNHYQSQQISIYAPSEKFQKEVIARTFKCLFQIDRSSLNDKKTNNDIIEQFVKYQFDFFACPELAKEFENENQKLTKQVFPETYGKNGNLIQWSHTLYRPIAMDFYYDGKKEVIAVEINFASINDFMSNSGLAIQQYVNFGCPGQGYSFPKINQITQAVELDNDTIHATPVTHAQIDFYGVAAINSIAFFGYENNEIANKDGSVTERIFAPSEIYFDGNFQKPIYDNTKQKALAAENYYYIQNPIPDIVTKWNAWQDIIAARTFNPFYQKHYEGFLKLTNTKKEVQDTNLDSSSGTAKYKYTITDENFLKKDVTDKVITKNFSNYTGIFGNNIYFQGNKLGLRDFSNYKNVPMNGIQNCFLKNHILNSNVHQLPVNIESSLAISESINISIGSVLGKFVPFAGFFGAFLNQKLPLGFRIGKNTPKSNYDGFDLIMACPIFDLAVAVAVADYIPMDYFRSGTNDSLMILGGQNSTTTSFLGSLTNQVTLYPFLKKDNTMGSSEIKKTYFVGQENKAKDSNYFYTPDSEVRPRNDYLKGFIITGFGSNGLAKTDYRLSYFNKPWTNKEKEVNNDDMISMSYHKTKSNFSNNIFLWETKIIHGNPFFDIEKKFIFPKAYDPSIVNKAVLVPDISKLSIIKKSDTIPNHNDRDNPIEPETLMEMTSSFVSETNKTEEWNWDHGSTVTNSIKIKLDQSSQNPNALAKNIDFVEFQKDFQFDNINFYAEAKYPSPSTQSGVTYQKPNYFNLQNVKLGKDVILNKKTPQQTITIPWNYDIYCIGTRQKIANGDHAVGNMILTIVFTLKQDIVEIDFYTYVGFNNSTITFLERGSYHHVIHNKIYQALTWKGSSNLNNLKFGYLWV